MKITNKILEKASQGIHRITSDEQNVSEKERMASGAIGAALVGFAIERLSKNSWITGTLSAIVGGGFVYRALTGHCSIYKSLNLNSFKPMEVDSGVAADKGVKVEKSITISKPAETLYQFWKNLENLPRIMSHLKSVEITDATHSHWIAKAPVGTKVEWDAEIINERENELIAWKSVEGSQVDNAGSVRFYQNGNNTEVRVNLKYDPPGGKMGVIVAKLFGRDAATEIEEDLAHFKQLMESKESRVQPQ